MNVVAYCRVSTDKSDQINSLETQKAFFESYCERNHLNLIHTYADEGISGTKTRNRTEFLQMMRDSEKGIFSQVIVKDVSRLARNTVDLLQSVRKLKALQIETVFITSDMKAMGNSEFVLTLMGAMAQEESSNMSKRVRFGKRENAKKGRVPNLVYGYDKTVGDYFHLKINDTEAEVVRRIYRWYAEEGYGSSKIAQMLNERGICTKRGCRWSQNAVSRILKNEIYIGKIVNGKEEIADFLTGSRREIDESHWMITWKPELAIVDENQFAQAQKMLAGRKAVYGAGRGWRSNRYPFSTLIRCADCGCSFRRIERTYKNTYISWVCSGRNAKGTGSCQNRVRIREEELWEAVGRFVLENLTDSDRLCRAVVAEFRARAERDGGVGSCCDEGEKGQPYALLAERGREMKTRIRAMRSKKEKMVQLYLDEMITREELREKTGWLMEQISMLEEQMKLLELTEERTGGMERTVTELMGDIRGIWDEVEMTSSLLRQIIRTILVYPDGRVEIEISKFAGEKSTRGNIVKEAL